MRKMRLVVLALVLAALLGGFSWWQWATGAIAPELKTQNSKLKAKEEIFVVEKGEGISLVAEKLEKERLIRSSLAFRILVAQKNLGKKIQAGDFRLNPGMTLLEIVSELTHGTLDIWITIPEGWRAEEIADAINFQFPIFARNQALLIPPKANQALLISNSQFLELAKEHEGRLFPDTYLIPKEASAEKIVDIFLKNFDKKFDEDLRHKAAKQGLEVDQVLILASIVEREARLDKDRPIVAGILIKRWQNDWPLQADATVQYAVASQELRVRSQESGINWWPQNLTKEDLKIDSPYNTYQNKGLPPGPICNPGLASIKAVLYYQQTEFWYYLSDSAGQMHYAKTNEEHAENINNYLRLPK